MTEESENSAESPADRALPGRDRRNQAAEPTSLNPYQAPSYHPDDRGGVRPETDAAPGPAFWLTAALLMTLALVASVFTYGAALPLTLGVVLGTMRAFALFALKKSRYSRIPAAMLLVTSTFLTLLLMFCCAIAFVTICTTVGLATEMRDTALVVWSVVCITVALAAFVFMFIRSMKWGV